MSAVLDKNGRPMRLAGAVNTTPAHDDMAKALHVCNHGNDVQAIAEYMVAEMNRNPHSEQGKKMAEANAFDPVKEMKNWQAAPWYARLGPMPDYFAMKNGMRAAAYYIWAERVGPGRPWDHKPILSARLRRQRIFRIGWQRYGNNDYFYDIWSNIHYGFVGVACGFSADELLGGAGLAQAASDITRDLKSMRVPTVQHHPGNGAWANSFDDIPDHISITLGMQLYHQTKPGTLTVAALLKAIAAVPLPWGAGANIAKRPHLCSP